MEELWHPTPIEPDRRLVSYLFQAPSRPNELEKQVMNILALTLTIFLARILEVRPSFAETAEYATVTLTVFDDTMAANE